MEIINLSIDNAIGRGFIREQLIEVFKEETPGELGFTSKYRYNVEFLENDLIYLSRPAPLNKGFDFIIYTEKYNFGKNRMKRNPSHNDILEDLINKKNESPQEYNRLYNIILDIFNCKIDPTNSFGLNFTVGIPVELLLKIIKWLFIEQDITYWNYSGRYKFKDAIDNV